MPAFLITYTSNHQHHAIRHEIEWVCSTGYDRDRALQTFQARFPAAAILHCKPVN
jgi:GTP cyclohydrolase III